MKVGVVNRFVLHTLQRNITHLAVITRKTNIKLGILKGGETGKEPKIKHLAIITRKTNIKLGILKGGTGKQPREGTEKGPINFQKLSVFAVSFISDFSVHIAHRYKK